MSYVFEGDSVEILHSREEVAKILGVKRKQLFYYMEAGSLFLDTLRRFRTEDGGISGTLKLTNFDIPVLTKVQYSFRKYGKAQARLHMSQNQDYYYQKEAQNDY